MLFQRVRPLTCVILGRRLGAVGLGIRQFYLSLFTLDSWMTRYRIRNNLDYIQNAGFTAVWISPVNQNYEGPRTAYGDPYHGYWIANISKINDRFGTADDLKSLSAELHRRNMYLMVDVVVNNVMATSTTPDYSPYFFNDESYYHPYCPIVWGNTTSEQDCWLGDEKVALPDLDTRNTAVIERYGEWIQHLVQEYSIDGLRIDAAKFVRYYMVLENFPEQSFVDTYKWTSGQRSVPRQAFSAWVKFLAAIA
ncbi:hypothetical protein C0992_010338 [Termitomyces sp. T32_za158]|nr:hypothetical protein C0992_010338 [Termitomyces sp. T32_za158]